VCFTFATDISRGRSLALREGKIGSMLSIASGTTRLRSVQDLTRIFSRQRVSNAPVLACLPSQSQDGVWTIRESILSDETLLARIAASADFSDTV
jgi:hypothetical protein